MNTAYLVSVFIHVICAAFWVGGMLFLPLVLLPSIRNNQDRSLLLQSTGIKFRCFGWVALLGLTVTGIFNLTAKGFTLTFDFLLHQRIGQLLTVKLVLFILMLGIGAIHDFYVGNKAVKAHRSAQITKVARWSGRINLILALVIAFYGVLISRGG